MYWLSYDIACVWRGSLPALYSPRGRVTSWLDLGDNRKVITDYRNHGIIRILLDLVVSLGYLPGVLREASNSVVPHKASSSRLGHPWGHSPCGLPWVSDLGSYPPHLVLERLVPIVQRRLELVRAGANKAEQSNSWSNHRDELPSSMNHRRVA